MSTIDFHTHLADPVTYACRLLRKAVGAGQRVQVRASAQVLARLDVALWTFSPLDFVAHASTSAPASVQNRSPVLLVDTNAAPIPFDVDPENSRGVLVTMTPDFDALAPWVGSHPRVIELVGDSEPELAAARLRYKQYRSQPGSMHTLALHDRTHQ